MCAEGAQGGFTLRGAWKWPSYKGSLCISAGHLGSFSGNFAFSDSHSFSPFSAPKGLCALLLGSLAVLFVLVFFSLTAGGQEMSLSAAIILRGKSRQAPLCGQLRFKHAQIQF